VPRELQAGQPVDQGEGLGGGALDAWGTMPLSSRSPNADQWPFLKEGLGRDLLS
jgi:hypothetical protein